ncbi:hypothetical protein BD289DRAFT_486362 [Coniella lustricola]|uniref:Uncharacterized protein n=1 Tax=Coniella lustricola TaxID=2025994 RepID=A0A2T2ZVE2_9PEZI|nr:hypothetical protein BD289DRAFT_486362 [Coniella lustricola]
MAKNLNQAKYDRAGWRLRMLLPLWIAQISLLLLLIGTSAYLFHNALKQNIEVRATGIAWECINIGISVVSILCTAYEVFRTMTEALTPKTMLVSNVIKLFGVTLSMIMDGMVSGSSLDGWSDGMFVIHALLVICLLVTGSYATWKWKQVAQYDDYHLPGANTNNPYGLKGDMNPRAYKGHARVLSEDLDWDPELEMGNSVEIFSSTHHQSGIMAPSPGEATPTFAEQTTTTTTNNNNNKRDSASSFINLGGHKTFSMNPDQADSSTALMAIDTAYDPVGSCHTPPAESDIALSQQRQQQSNLYSHTRDTSFDQYVAETKQKRRMSQRMSIGSNHWTPPSSSRSSPVTSPIASSRNRSDSAAAYRLSLNLKSDIDDALGAEFGWTHSRSSSQDSVMVTGQPSGIAVSGGRVASAKNVRDSLGRAPSDGSERGALGIVSESAEDEFDESDRRRNVDETSRALLGESSTAADASHPELLRPGRPKSEQIAFVVTPPPKSPSPGVGVRGTWGSAYARP